MSSKKSLPNRRSKKKKIDRYFCRVGQVREFCWWVVANYPSRSHALRGNACSDAPRPLSRDAERRKQRFPRGFVFSVQAVAKTMKSVPLAVPVLENRRLDGMETLAQPVAHKNSIVSYTLNTNPRGAWEPERLREELRSAYHTEPFDLFARTVLPFVRPAIVFEPDTDLGQLVTV